MVAFQIDELSLVMYKGICVPSVWEEVTSRHGFSILNEVEVLSLQTHS